MTSLSSADIARLRRLEEELWRPETRFDRAYMDLIFASDFIEFGRSGRIYGREEMINSGPQPIDVVLPLPDFQARPLSAKIAQVTYNSQVTYDGVVLYGRRSSIWRRTADGWQLCFHQGTPYEERNAS